jgi:hypothetical protein
MKIDENVKQTTQNIENIVTWITKLFALCFYFSKNK